MFHFKTLNTSLSLLSDLGLYEFSEDSEELDMKSLILLLILNSYGESRSLNIREAACTEGPEVCDQSDIQRAIDIARRTAEERYESVAAKALLNQSATCTQAVSEFNSQCNKNLFDEIINNINQIRQNIDLKVSKATDLKDQGTAPNANIQSIITKLEGLVEEIRALRSELAEQRNRLDQLNQTCEQRYNDVEIGCAVPTVYTSTDTIRVVEHSPNQSAPEHRVPAVEAEETQVAAATIALTVNGHLEPTPQIQAQRSTAETARTHTTNSSQTTQQTLTATDNYAKTQINWAQGVVASLRPLAGDPNRDRQGHDGCTAAGSLFDPNCASATAQPTTQDVARAAAKPDVAPNPAAAVGATTGEPETGAQRTTAGRTQEQIMQDATATAYGAQRPNTAAPGTNDPAADPNRTGTTPAQQQAAARGQGGGLGSALSGLGSLFGKSNGNFGSDGYQHNSRFAGQADNPRARSGPGFNIPTHNSTHLIGSNEPSVDNPAMRGRGFNTAPQNTNGFMGGAPGVGGMPAGNMNGANGAGNTNNSPGLIGRMLGKRDKTLFGKAVSSGRGGSGINGNSQNQGQVGLNPDGSPNTGAPTVNANGERVFDPSKYAPSRQAQEQAHARATGRKIASYSQNPNDRSEWPRDINRNKMVNMFKSVNMVHRSKLNNQ